MAPNSTLKLAIFDSGLTQTVIAQKTGIHESRLSRIVRGHVLPSSDERRALARALRKSIGELFEPEAVAS